MCRRFLLLLPVLLSCSHRPAAPGHDAADVAADRRPSAGVWWSPGLELASQSTVGARLEKAFEDPIDVAACATPASCDQRTMTSCASYFALRAKDYEPRMGVDLAPMKLEGARCAAIRALGSAKAATRGSLADFHLDARALAALPPALGPGPSPDEVQDREQATRAGQSWAARDPQARLTPTGPDQAKVATSEWTTEIQLLARGDFDGDGADDLLLRTLSYGTEGSWREVRLRLLTRAAGKPVLAIVRELPL